MSGFKTVIAVCAVVLLISAQVSAELSFQSNGVQLNQVRETVELAE